MIVEMSVRTVSKLFFLLLGLALLGNCGQFDMVVSTGDSYQIRTLVNNTFLDDCSLISTGANIRPYCDNSITRDPDISELLLFFQNSQGETVGGKIRYVLKIDAVDHPQTEESPDAGQTDEGDSAEDPEVTIDEEDNSENSEASEDTIDTIDEEGSPEESEESEETKEEEIKLDLPAEEPDSREETAIHVKRFDRHLPSFTIPVDMEIGTYTLVIRVISGSEIIGETKQDFFYLGNAYFSLKDIQLYLPGSSSSKLIPLGTTVLLEAKIEADRHLNPYIVWHNGRKIIQEGSLSDGANLVFWKAPELTGFHTLRAEIFPSHLRRGVQGISRDIVLPVSAKASGAGFFPDQNLSDFVITSPDFSPEAKTTPENNPVAEWHPDPIHWYQFAGTLHDSNNRLATEKTLVPVTEGLPRWKPMDYSYGLVTGPSDIYSLPLVSFFQEGEQKGGGLFLFRIKALSEGTLLNAVFESNDQVKISISYNGEHLALSLSSRGRSAKEALIPLNKPDETGVHISAALLFNLFEDRLEARLILQEGDSNQSVSLGTGARRLNGKCQISIGGMANSGGDSETSLQSPSEEQTRRRNRRQKPPETAIWNEFAVLYMVPPEEPVLVEFDIADIAEDEISEDENEETASVAPVEKTTPVAAKVIPEENVEKTAVAAKVIQNEESETEAIIDEQEEETESLETETVARIENEMEEPSNTMPENN
jgi:hypothetical protein